MGMATTRIGVQDPSILGFHITGCRTTAITRVRFRDLELEWEGGREVRRLGEAGFRRDHRSVAALAVSAADDDW
jgi:hypothetical protein